MGILTEPSRDGLEHRPFSISDTALDDLMLTDFMRSIFAPHTSGESFEWKKYLTASEEIILYRREVIRELLKNSDVIEKLNGLCKSISMVRKMKDMTASGEYGPDYFREFGLLQDMYLRMKDVETSLKAHIEDGSVRSEALQILQRLLTVKIAQHFPEGFEAKWDQFTSGLETMKSMKVTFHFDEEMKIQTVSLDALNKEKYSKGKLLHKKEEMNTVWDLNPLKAMTTPTYELQEALLHTNQRAFYALLNKMTMNLEDLYSDVIFYLGALEFIHRMKDHSARICFPSLLKAPDRSFSAQGMLNPVLLVKNPKKIKVDNHIEFCREGEIFLITGINQGGKTTFLRTVGMVQFFTQLGWPAVAEKASISLVDRIVTVFSHEENTGLQQGKLGQELSTMKAGLREVTKDSLLLCNEPITGTSPMENLYLSRIILTACKVNGYKGIWVTHLYDLAARAAAMNQELPGSTISSLVANVHHVENKVEASYRIERGEPEFTSYAREVLNREAKL